MDKYLLMKTGNENSYAIMNYDSDCFIGLVNKREQSGFTKPKFVVITAFSEKVAIVDSLDEVIPAIVAYYERNPPQWKLVKENVFDYADALHRQGAQYVKHTQLCTLSVKEVTPNDWVAYRGEEDCELLFGEKIAVFKTLEEAQRMADEHLRDGYPNAATINDGYRWLPDDDWQKNPRVVANRAKKTVLIGPSAPDAKS